MSQLCVLATQLGVESICEAIEGNFLSMPFPDATFDAAYAIEATCHADKVRLWQHAKHEFASVTPASTSYTNLTCKRQLGNVRHAVATSVRRDLPYPEAWHVLCQL